MTLNRNEKIAVSVGVVVVFGILLGGTILSQSSMSSVGYTDETTSTNDERMMGDPTQNDLPQELTMTDDVAGTGAVAEAGKMVSVHYTGMLPDGTVFDSSVSRGQPFSFALGAGQVIAGWDQGVQGMRVGGKRRLVIPPGMAYGANGVPPVIPPNATLIFDVELLSVQ